MKSKFLILMFLMFSDCLIADNVDCDNPVSTQEMRNCENKSLAILESKMNIAVKEISAELLQDQGQKVSDDFLKIQKDWENLVSRQCLNERTIYGRGSIGGISQITCIEYFYQKRIDYFKVSYQQSI